MTAEVIKFNSPQMKEQSIPDAMQKIEDADSAFVITMKNGNWNFQSVGNDKPTLEVIGLLRIVSRKLEQMCD